MIHRGYRDSTLQSVVLSINKNNKCTDFDTITKLHGEADSKRYRGQHPQSQRKDYICLTDMLRAKDGDFFITDWLRNRNTLEFIGIWEKVYNPTFNYGEFAIIKS